MRRYHHNLNREIALFALGVALIVGGFAIAIWGASGG